MYYVGGFFFNIVILGMRFGKPVLRNGGLSYYETACMV